MEEFKYCRNCKQLVTPTKGPGRTIAALIALGYVLILPGFLSDLPFRLGIPLSSYFNFLFLMLFLMVVITIIYGIAKKEYSDRCPICNSRNWGEPPKGGRE